MPTRIGLSFDDVLIVPAHHSAISSRSHVRTNATLGIMPVTVPILAAPMDTVASPALLAQLARLGTFGIMHRYCSMDDQITALLEATDLAGPDPAGTLGFAIGTKPLDNNKLDILCQLADVICVDVANGDHYDVLDVVTNMRKRYPQNHIMSGNVATGDGFRRLQDAGADSIRVGIGPGAACSTRVMTGIGVPQLTAIEDCAAVADNAGIIADGGIRNPGDLCKAIAAGADVCMLGSIFAGTDEAPGDVQKTPDGKLVKYFRGMASVEAQNARGTKGPIVPEGVDGFVEYRGTVADVIHQFEGGLRSSMTYVNAGNVKDYYRNTEFIQVTAAGVAESSPHDMLRSLI